MRFACGSSTIKKIAALSYRISLHDEWMVCSFVGRVYACVYLQKKEQKLFFKRRKERKKERKKLRNKKTKKQRKKERNKDPKKERREKKNE